MKDDEDVTRYFKQIDKIPLLTRDQEHELAIQAKKGSQQAKDKLVTSNLRFVVQQAHTFKGHIKYGKVTLLDLIQEGNEGLLKAVDKFEPDAGTRFISYAVWWIRAGMQRLVTNNFSTVKIGTTSVQRKLFFKLGQLYTIIHETDSIVKQRLREELAKQTEVTVQNILDMEERLSWKDESTALPLDSKRTDSDTIEDLLVETQSWSEHIEDRDNYNEALDILYLAIATLKPKEQHVIKERWLGSEKRTLESIGEELNVSRERIRQIEANALRKIKDAIKI